MTSDPRPLIVTTSIPYVNARPHVGFALELVLGDVHARRARRRGRHVWLQTGTDEHAQKNVVAAAVAGVDVVAFVDAHATAFAALVTALDVEIDDFVRTHSARHAETVRWFWQRLDPRDLVVRHYRGRYCVGCEDFVRDDELVGGVCVDHGVAPVDVEEENVFFCLSRYAATLEALIVDDTLRIEPAARKAEVLAFLRRGLFDFSVTRAAARARGWGIPVPGDDGQVVYVWVDALLSYLTGPGLARWSSSEVVHHIGKNVWKFHALYWPALLLSARLPLPSTLVVHGFLTENGKKISKSSGGGVDPVALVDEFGVDAVRYALLASAPAHDSDFSVARLQALYVGDLQNGVGNTVSRLCALAARAGVAGVADDDACDDDDRDLAAVVAEFGAIDVEIAAARPWELLASDVERLRRAVLPPWLHRARRAGRALAPFLPSTSAKIEAALSATPLAPIAPIFPRRGPQRPSTSKT